MKILVVSPHPDDETLAAGGTILRYKKEGKKVYWLNITNVKEEYGYSKERVISRNKEIDRVNKLYNFDGFYNLGLEPAGLDKYSKGELIGKISEVVKEVKPNVVILPYKYDVHSDHELVYDCVYSCTKSFRHPFVKKVLAMEIISETDFASYEHGFIPNYFVDISAHLDKKIEVLQIYESELGAHPFPRSIDNIKALATLRGASAGVRYAESFMLIKNIE